MLISITFEFFLCICYFKWISIPTYLPCKNYQVSTDLSFFIRRLSCLPKLIILVEDILLTYQTYCFLLQVYWYRSTLHSFCTASTPTRIRVLRLFCDGCGGQNKNSHIIHILLYWLVKSSPQHVREILITYPVRGHSFLPADRVFGRVEKELKVHPTITTKEEYNEYYSKFGQVHVLSNSWNLLDLKGLESYFKRIERIQKYKKISIKKLSFRTAL